MKTDSLCIFNKIPFPVCVCKNGVITFENPAYAEHISPEKPRKEAQINIKGKIYDVKRSLLDSGEELFVFNDITARCLLKAENEKYRKEIDLAKNIQSSIMRGSLPVAEGFSFRLFYYPSAQVGGDLFDALRLPDGRILMYVADVSGHGLSAAMMTVFFKQEITIFCKKNTFSFAGLVNFLNERLCELGCDSRVYLTLVLAILNTDTGELKYHNAGHSAIPLICRKDGSVEELYSPGVPICNWGIEEDFIVKMTSLDHGERLILYTDGVFPSKEYEESYRRFKQRFSSNDYSEDGFISKYEDEMSADNEDDILMMIVSRI